MFGLTSIVPPTIGPPPKNVPPATPITLPRCTPQVPDSPSEDGSSEPSLVRFLQTLHRPTDISDAHFAALGVHVHPDVPAEDVVPDPSYLPSASGWDGIDLDEARRRDSAGFRRPLSNGNTSPEARVFFERRNELSIPNQAAFRTVRRIKPVPGKQAPRLGNCYEFFKQLDQMATFWDDTSMPPWTGSGDDDDNDNDNDNDNDQQQGGEETTTSPAQNNGDTTTTTTGGDTETPERVTYRTGTGSAMPPEFRHNLISAFIKLVAYDFGCNLAPPRLEPRLHLLEPPHPPSPNKSSLLSPPSAPSRASAPVPAQRASYFPSGCVFICRIPTTRDAARQGFMDGPVAAVSARNTTGFSFSSSSPSPSASPTTSDADLEKAKEDAAARLDLGRELVAALIAAQHRARAGREERRFGEGKWWATQKRWGGGEGGPIGREVEGDAAIVGDKDAAAGEVEGPVAPSSSSSSAAKGRSSGVSTSRSPPSLMSLRGGARGMAMGIGGIAGGIGGARKSRKGPTVYDSYRKVRPPSSNWDRKVRYEPIGRVRGADYDDVFVVSSLFHHVSVLRVRVPERLLDVLDGGVEEQEEGEGEGRKEGIRKGGRSWGKLEVWRSRWFDLFLVEERLEAMRLVWGMMAWVMRKDEGDEGAVGGEGKKAGDVDMAGT
ncbi:hypothetical protein F4810DRAFT_473769 [Camillea tinctor]|nr:hypothetical protein F4810DRAFT_473769 [Camillea tinctor]